MNINATDEYKIRRESVWKICELSGSFTVKSDLMKGKFKVVPVPN
jgi:hypothetical protein